VDFRNTIIIMTSNVGTRQLNDFGVGIGFNADEIGEKLTEHMLTKALNRTFPPEFVNRLDNIVVFNPLDENALAQILTLELHPLKLRLEAMGYKLQLTKKTKEQLLERSRDRKYGARPLKRAIQVLIEDPITDILLSGSTENKTIKI
jgi:ATP-dependent Clp protease ATP-binding subunit ClpC